MPREVAAERYPFAPALRPIREAPAKLDPTPEAGALAATENAASPLGATVSPLGRGTTTRCDNRADLGRVSADPVDPLAIHNFDL